MASGLTLERRGHARVSAADGGWQSAGTLRPGHELRLVDLAPGGVAIETGARVAPGARVEVQLGRGGVRYRAAGLVRRCHVIALHPLRFSVAIALDEPLDLSLSIT